MLNERALRTILVVLGLFIVGALLVAVYQGAAGNDTISLAVVGVMATLALAFAAVLTLEQNRSLVKAAAEEAVASREQAVASQEIVEEMRREREWAYKPMLVITRGYLDPPPTGFEQMRPPLPAFIVRNIGTGPALNVALGAHTFSGEHRWLSASVPGLAPGAEERVAIVYRRDPQPDGYSPDRYRCLVDEWPVAKGEEAVAVRYEDWFGTHYRSAGGPRLPHPNEWRGQPGTMDQPAWLRCNY